MVANAIESLMRRIPPPERPVEARGNWRTVEKNFGMHFPIDYKALIKAYGTGGFFEWMWIYNPFSENKNVNLYSAAATTMKVLKKYGGQSLARFPDDAFLRSLVEQLDAGSIFPCGVTDNGDDLFWRTEGPPDRWGMTVLDFRDGARQDFDLSLTQFLLAITHERLNCSLFPELTPPFDFRQPQQMDEHYRNSMK